VKFATIATSFLIGLVTGISFVPVIATQEKKEINFTQSSQFPEKCLRKCWRG
jgi:hypothetical protein